MGACLDRLPEDDDESDCWDVLERTPTERLARAAFVFSRAIAAIDNLLFLAWWPAEELGISLSRAEEVGERRRPVEPYDAIG